MPSMRKSRVPSEALKLEYCKTAFYLRSSYRFRQIAQNAFWSLPRLTLVRRPRRRSCAPFLWAWPSWVGSCGCPGNDSLPTTPCQPSRVLRKGWTQNPWNDRFRPFWWCVLWWIHTWRNTRRIHLPESPYDFRRELHKIRKIKKKIFFLNLEIHSNLVIRDLQVRETRI